MIPNSESRSHNFCPLSKSSLCKPVQKLKQNKNTEICTCTSTVRLRYELRRLKHRVEDEEVCEGGRGRRGKLLIKASKFHILQLSLKYVTDSPSTLKLCDCDVTCIARCSIGVRVRALQFICFQIPSFKFSIWSERLERQTDRLGRLRTSARGRPRRRARGQDVGEYTMLCNAQEI